ncbi:MAG: GNAT family N-acetyltransferase [Deltaproteobacteria bacterium]|nr:GNAT family N-acetyltransferase [Deltaproteobacteria bacterium]
MLSYQEHYRQYLGYNPKQTGNLIVCHSSIRDKLETQRKPLLLSFLNRQQVVISASTDLLGKVRRMAVTLSRKKMAPAAWFKRVDDLIYNEFKLYQIDHYIRMTIGQNDIIKLKKCDQDVRALGLADKKTIFGKGPLLQRGKKSQDHFWEQNKRYIKEGRCFGLVRNGQILSRAAVEPIECGGGNIAVATEANHRKKGYGKMVVSAAVNWCFEHDILPIYYVKSDNVASIALARSLGFKLKNKEIIVSHWPGDAWNKYKVNDQMQN